MRQTKAFLVYSLLLACSVIAYPITYMATYNHHGSSMSVTANTEVSDGLVDYIISNIGIWSDRDFYAYKSGGRLIVEYAYQCSNRAAAGNAVARGVGYVTDHT